jgi:uncharacterized membrane protein YdjX (TVP38/TMEM64 family)
MKPRSRAILKAVLLVVFIVASVAMVRFTTVGEFLSKERLSALLDATGFVAPAVFVGIYALGLCLFIPASVLTTLGAAIFGAYWGFVVVWTGAVVGSGAAFYIGRYLGRDFAASLVGERLRKYDEAIERNGFATVLYLRLIYFPFTPLNFGMGLTKIRFRDYIVATGLGMLMGTFVFTFFVGTLKDAWLSGGWRALVSWKLLLAVALFVFSLLIPKMLKGLRERSLRGNG